MEKRFATIAIWRLHLVATWKCHESDVSSLAGVEKIEEEKFIDIFIQQVWTSVARLESLGFTEAVSCGLKEYPWSIEALSGLGISAALRLGQRTSTNGTAPGIALQTWGCTFNIPTSPCIQDLKYPLHLILCDNVGMATVQNTLALTGPPTCCRVNCCLHVANWGQWRAAHILCELLSHFRIIWNWFRV